MKIQGANPDSFAKVCACGAGGRQSQWPSPAAATAWGLLRSGVTSGI